MSLTQRLDLRTTQSLVMTPQLQQAIKLLQMSNAELDDFITEEIERNPLLERDEHDSSDFAEDVVPAPVEAEPSALTGDAMTEPDSTHEDFGPESDSYAADDRYGSGSNAGDSDYAEAHNVATGPSLRDHLLGQIHVDFTDPADRLIAVALVDSLDENGYLPATLDVTREHMGVSEATLARIIARLQAFDPPGIFARSLPECLALQLREKNRFDPAMQTLVENLDLMARHEHAKLMKLCGVDAEDLAEMLQEIRALNPKPASAFTADVAPPITPDVILRPLAGGTWHIELNAENLPRVLANERYYTQIQRSSRGKAEKDYLTERWQHANWLTKALHQRATTILKVAAEIVKQQDAFFAQGIQFLKPMVLRDIAAAVEMHESTVSRVTQNKYITTPRGLFELKYFFTNAIATTGGEISVAATAVRDRIKDIIDLESPTAILSDDTIADKLRAEGIILARRTVAKYREALRLPSSAQRRREKKGG